MFSRHGSRKSKAGFTLVELAVVVVIIGVLAAFGVPRFRDAVERSKASEAFDYLSSVRSAQERHHARTGIYADALGKLDIAMPAPRYFSVGAIAATTGTLEENWALTLTRQGASAGYGAYTVQYDHAGYVAASSTIETKPAINPNVTS